MREIIFPEKIFKKVKDHILKDSPREQFAFLLCGHNKVKDLLKLLVREAVIPDKKDIAYQHSGGVCPKKDFQIQVYQRCYDEKLDLIDVHSHPFALEKVFFSHIDDLSELGTTGKDGTFTYLTRKINGIHLASLVFGKNSIDARLYVPERKKAFPIDRIRILGNTVEDITPTSSHQKNENYYDGKDFSLYSRQILAFGEYGQEKLSRTRVGVIVAGGIGSIVTECLARLGVGEILCVDNDIIEESNISRMLGSFPDDAKNRRRKVEVMQRHVERINSRITFEGIVGSVLDPSVLEKLKKVDCLISGTDTQSSRLVLNSFSVQYLIPFIDLGTEIVLDGERKRIDQAGGKVRIVRPGMWCLRCYPGEIDETEVARETASDFDRKRDIRLGYIRGADIPDPSVISLNMTVASLGISEFLNLFTGYKGGATYIAYYLLRTEVKNVSINHGNDHCPICGRDGLLGLGDRECLQDIRESGPLLSLPEPNFKRELLHETDTTNYTDKSEKMCLPDSARGSSTASTKTKIKQLC
jgi:molybdopterin/thiamine biosynthesis adenylyltransferase